MVCLQLLVFSSVVPNMNQNDIHCVLLDIEGTTTSISFVKDILFPHVKQNIESFIKSKWNDPLIQGDVDALQKQSEIDVSQSLEGAVLIQPLSENPTPSEINIFQSSIISNVLWQMSLDRKTTALKQLQGHIWVESYKNGEIYGHVYDDVPEALAKWKSDGIKIYIYSSGSVEAQKILFQYSIHGNLLKFIDGHFDTNIGPKVEESSYTAICKCIGIEPSVTLFLTDVHKEAQAARQAGLQTLLVIRVGNAPLSETALEDFKTINSFFQLFV